MIIGIFKVLHSILDFSTHESGLKNSDPATDGQFVDHTASLNVFHALFNTVYLLKFNESTDTCNYIVLLSD